MENEKNMEKVVGAAFEDMNVEEMENIQGAGDVEAEATPATPAIAGAVSAIASAVSGAVLSAVKC